MKAPYNELCTVCKEMITAGKHDIVEDENSNWIHVKGSSESRQSK